MGKNTKRGCLLVFIFLFSGIIFTMSINSTMNGASSTVMATDTCITTAAVPTIDWNVNGSLASVNTSDQSQPIICNGGDGTAIMVWYDTRSGVDLYAQKLDTNGQKAWTSDGVVICNATDNQLNPEIISDGDGGAIIVWDDERGPNFEVYAQKINSTGHVKWGNNGTLLCDIESTIPTDPKLCTDGDGGAIITWQDPRALNYDIYAQRINKSGDLLWGLNGTAICNYPYWQANPEIISDGAGGAIIAWHDYNRTGLSNVNIYAQRVDGDGVRYWVANGTVISDADEDKSNVDICSDGSHGAILAWDDLRGSADLNIYAQRIDENGIVKWIDDVVLICTAAEDQKVPELCEDGACGAIITWRDERSSLRSDVYAQRIDADGETQWTHNGVAICNHTELKSVAKICIEGNGGAYLTWQDNRSGNRDVYGQKINSLGQAQWTINGTLICNANGTQTPTGLCSDGSGGAFLAWLDERYVASDDVYAQHVTGQILPDGGDGGGGGGSIWDLLNMSVPLFGFLLIFVAFTIGNIVIHLLYARRGKTAESGTKLKK